MQFKLMGTKYIKIKKNVVPHKFECQAELALLIHDESNLMETQTEMFSTPSYEEKPGSSGLPAAVPASVVFQPPPTDTLELTISTDVSFSRSFCHKSVSVKPAYRSKGTMTDIRNKSIACSPFKHHITGTSASPVIRTKVRRKLSGQFEEILTSSSQDTEQTDDEVQTQKLSSDYSMSEEVNTDTEEFKKDMQKMTIKVITIEPVLYLDIPKSCYFVINLLAANVKCNTIAIMLTLKKKFV